MNGFHQVKIKIICQPKTILIVRKEFFCIYSGMLDNYSRNSSGGGRDDSSASDDGDNQSVQFFVGGAPAPSLAPHHNTVQSSSNSLSNINVNSISSSSAANTPTSIQQQSPLNSYSEYNSHARYIHFLFYSC